MNTILGPFYGYIILIILFFTDLVINNIAHQPYSFCLMAGFAVLACYTRKTSYLMMAIMLLMVQSCLYYDWCIVPLIYGIPLIIMNLIARKLFYPTSWLSPLILVYCLSIQFFISAWISSGVAPEIPYTSGTFIANMVLTWCFSLTYIMQGNLDNRL